MKDMFEKVLSQLMENKPVVLMTIYKSSGSTPRKAGAKMACFCDFSTMNTIGGGAIEHDAINCAKELFKTKSSYSKTYVLKHNEFEEDSMVCGGMCSVFFQYIEPNDINIEIISKVCELIQNNLSSWLITVIDDGWHEMGLYITDEGYYGISEYSNIKDILKTVPALSKNEMYFTQPLSQGYFVYIFGGGHIAKALCPLLTACDFRVVIYEDNEKFATKEFFPDAEKIICASYDEIEKHVEFFETDSAVVLTRGHKSDNKVIKQLLEMTYPFYLGVIGSKQKVASMREHLLSCGFSEDEIASIHSPIGLPINAQTPAEIAVSICAELIQTRAQYR